MDREDPPVSGPPDRPDPAGGPDRARLTVDAVAQVLDAYADGREHRLDPADLLAAVVELLDRLGAGTLQGEPIDDIGGTRWVRVDIDASGLPAGLTIEFVPADDVLDRPVVLGVWVYWPGED